MTAVAEAPAQAEPMMLDLTWFTPVPDGPTDAMIAEHGWEVFGRCAGEDPDVMFPEDDDYAGQIESLKVCAGCPASIRAVCKQANDAEEFGTFAGELEMERRVRHEREQAEEKRRYNRERQRKRREALRDAA